MEEDRIELIVKDMKKQENIILVSEINKLLK